MNPDNLAVLKDDMVAFIEGHGMRHFPATISKDMPRVWWDEPLSDRNAAEPVHASSKESWKDFVEMAKTAGAYMVGIAEERLDRAALEMLSEGLREFADSESLAGEAEKLDELFRQVGKIGHIELAFAHQGVLFAHDTATDWYREYRDMIDTIDALQSFIEDALGSEEDPDQT